MNIPTQTKNTPYSKKLLTEMTIEDYVYLNVYCSLMVDDHGTFVDPTPEKLWKLTQEWAKPILQKVDLNSEEDVHCIASWPNPDIGVESVTQTVAPPLSWKPEPTQWFPPPPPKDRILKEGHTPLPPNLPTPK